MKMGTIRSPCLYDAAARHALLAAEICAAKNSAANCHWGGSVP